MQIAHPLQINDTVLLDDILILSGNQLIVERPHVDLVQRSRHALPSVMNSAGTVGMACTEQHALSLKERFWFHWLTSEKGVHQFRLFQVNSLFRITSTLQNVPGSQEKIKKQPKVRGIVSA